MGSDLRWLKSNVSSTTWAHLASLLVFAASIAFEAISTVYGGQPLPLVAFIPITVVIVYLEGRFVAIAATLLMAVAGLWMRHLLDGHLTSGDWTGAVFLLGSGSLIAAVFHRLRQDLHGALRVAEARLGAIDAAALGFANTNRHGELLQSNRRLLEMTGYAHKELAQLKLEELIVPDDRGTVRKLLEDLGNGTASATDIRVLRKDGTAFWAHLALSSSRPEEAPNESVFAVIDDISERQAAREALRAQKEWLDLAVSAGRLGTWQIDIEDGTVAGSGKFWDILGLPPAPVRRLEELSAVIHPVDWPKLSASAKPSSALNFDVEIRVRQVDGHTRWIALRGRQEEHGDRKMRIGVAADLTERRQTTLLRAAVKRRERIMREERHRFSNVFPVIRALVNMIDIPDNDVAKYKEMLIDWIRTLEATHRILSRHANLSGMLHELVDRELQPFKETRDITISGPSLTVPSGAAEGLAMILHELTTNSVKHGALGDPNGKVEVKWRFASEDEGDDLVFDWVESGRRKSSKVVRRGFGSLIIGVDSTPLVGHSPNMEITEDGLRYSLRVSRKEIEEFGLQ
ncbi:PAS domain S-box protein [Mesorhizobium sp. M0179]|uniref:PAS domain S-box protein n=1 Tax=unclassified Mesorhizobium TaxID=325217 RepID=UPI0003CDD0FE|nr:MULTISPECIES: PAS domain S-box protein [unclassified Mesorhizobium]ESX09945.1 diguanylate cyclase [Mesorhizobium sp. LSJC265A00]WJI70509.1 PAS domain S-box protein [Mesorhizobium sp. C399B]